MKDNKEDIDNEIEEYKKECRDYNGVSNKEDNALSVVINKVLDVMMIAFILTYTVNGFTGIGFTFENYVLFFSIITIILWLLERVGDIFKK